MILPEVRAKLKAAFEAQLPDVQIAAVKPGEDAALTDCVWVQKLTSSFDWRSLGHDPTNRIEVVTCTVKIRVYRTGPAQGEVAEQALARCEEILSKLEDAIEADFSLDDTVSFGRPASVAAELIPQHEGWVGDGTYVFEASNYPLT